MAAVTICTDFGAPKNKVSHCFHCFPSICHEVMGPDVEAETPILWPPDSKSWLIWKDPDVVKDWGQEEKGMTEDKMVGWHHQLNGHGFGWTLRVGDGQGGLACCGSWGCKESDTTERLNWTTASLSLLRFTEWLVDSSCDSLGHVKFHLYPRSHYVVSLKTWPHIL